MSAHASSSASFNREAIAAAALAIAGTAMIHSSQLFTHLHLRYFDGGSSLWLSVLAGAYLSYLCSRSSAPSGRLTLFIVWLAGTVAGLLFGASPLLLGAWQVLMISVTRAALFYPRPLAFCADLGLSALAGLAALWVSTQSSSLLLAIWSFFLVQAGWSWIANNRSATAATVDSVEANAKQTFDTAHATAVAAIRRLSRRSPP